MLKVKVCGITEIENLLKLDKLNLDFIGLNFYEKSPRYISKNFINDNTRKNISSKLIGIFVNQEVDSILSKVNEYDLSGVQLHGEESSELCSNLKERAPKLTVIKAIHAIPGLTFSAIKDYAKYIDYFLFDTPSVEYGGSGRSFNWEIVKKLKLKTPFFISGGVDINNYQEIIESLKNMPLAGLDINSKFEIKPGIKDTDQIFSFIEEVKIASEDYGVLPSGYFGEFGGAFIPEMLYPNIKELKENYLTILNENKFKLEYYNLLKNFVGRPTSLYKPEKLSKKVNFNVYLKREDLNHTGAHKINNAIGQALMAKKLNKKRIIAETGAGQHGLATATACALLGMECVVYMGEIDIERQLPNVQKMKLLGAKVVPVTSGSRVLKDAVNEAMREWISNPTTTHYIIGSSVGPHPFPDIVGILQSIIGKEALKQFQEQSDQEHPDAVIACVGGGSNAIGLFRPFLKVPKVKIFGVEAAGEGVNSDKTACSIYRGKKGVFHGALSLVLQDEEGQIEEAHSISAGLDYPGIGPEHAFLASIGRVKYLQATDQEALEAAYWLTKNEGIIPALESAHGLSVLEKLENAGVKAGSNIILGLSGRGDKDMESYLRNLC